MFPYLFKSQGYELRYHFLFLKMVMGATTIVVALLPLLLCTAAAIQLSTGNEHRSSGCQAAERLALLKFKQSLDDPGGHLSSWVGEDCCTWNCVSCSNRTGHVTKLKLRGPTVVNVGDGTVYYYLYGEINPSLLELKHLKYLDLSGNEFGASIPQFIGSLTSLRYLNISNAFGLEDTPHQLGNLTNLRYLDLQTAYRSYPGRPPVFDHLHWLSLLSTLQYLDMSGVNLTKAEVFHAVSNLSNLSVLRLSGCYLYGIPTSLPNVNLASLATLELSGNQFDSTVPDWLFNISSIVSIDLSTSGWYGSIFGFGNLTSLQVLQLRSNNFNGTMPASIGHLCNLRTLDLSYNRIGGDVSMLARCARFSLQTLDLRDNLLSGHIPDSIGEFRNLTSLRLGQNSLSGSIPPSIGKLSSLIYLDLENNGLRGQIPESIGQLSELVFLILGNNSFEGVISDAHFAKLANLRDLILSPNPLVVRMSPNWVPPFQIKTILMNSCVLGPNFPAWLRTQTAFSTIDISNTSISDTMPDWLWNFSSQVRYLNLSHNQIRGSIPISVTFRGIEFVDLSSNQFHGPLPHVDDDGVIFINLSNNLFSGDLLPVFFNMSEGTSSLNYLLLSGNSLSGTIPASVCKLFVVDLSSNLLSGEIPHCSNDVADFFIINFASNNLSGVIPSWIGNEHSLLSLHLNNNSFHGEIPSLENCSDLSVLDLGENMLEGNIPAWIGERLSSLTVLRLRSNMLRGSIPPQLSHLSHLQVLDLANNNLAGIIPRGFGNLSAMALAEHAIIDLIMDFTNPIEPIDYENTRNTAVYEESLVVEIKGMELDYRKNLHLVLSLDLSGNHLSGDIPEELTGLVGLQNLNLSKNHLSGTIPEKIGGLRQLESLDLSGNQLSGAIPSSISSLTYLSRLNLSDNNLSGRIPSGNQLQTLTDPSIYVGNHDLCGTPLLKKCPGDEMPEAPSGEIPDVNTNEGDEHEDLGYYLGAVLGFVVGFWMLCGTLLLNLSWRISYYKFIDNMQDRLCGVK